MENGNSYSRSTSTELFSNNTFTQTRAKSFLANVFAYMFMALAISGVVAWLLTSNIDWMITIATNKALTYAVFFSPLVFALVLGFAFQRLSVFALLAIFIAYSAVIGVSISFALIIYTQTSVVACFFSAAAMFGVMAFMGYTTKQDLTSFGRILTMGLIGIVIASVINFFLQNDTMSYIISFVGVMVFTGLTAYHMQKIKQIGEGVDANGNVLSKDVKKLSIIAGLTLYLDFINMFLMLLRLFGSRR